MSAESAAATTTRTTTDAARHFDVVLAIVGFEWCEYIKEREGRGDESSVLKLTQKYFNIFKK